MCVSHVILVIKAQIWIFGGALGLMIPWSWFTPPADNDKDHEYGISYKSDNKVFKGMYAEWRCQGYAKKAVCWDVMHTKENKWCFKSTYKFIK
ncbi:hypothetical protein PVK06_011853 [Gossypium arboreum]|uniref:Uncharacterized protein n=1 Tax=Gossypium arboreum TaxID=29729 RepID=A0ABR0QAS9_GOSAR|nr:hypothetical protein PVK06_011853 [Gossypium arboreum]